MAHHIKYKTKPHVNADGSKSPKKKDYIVTHKRRGKQTEVIAVVSSKSAAEEEVKAEKLRHWGRVR